MANVRDLWMRVERWVAAEPMLPSPDAMFGPPASTAAIAAAERVLGQPFSESFRASLLVHDGQSDEYLPWLPNQMMLLPLQDIVECWRGERANEGELDVDGKEETGEFDRVRAFATVTHAGRLPIAEHAGSSYMYLDFVPGPAGNPGQAIVTRTECDFLVAGKDFADFLARYADWLEQGVLRYDAAEYHSVEPADRHVTWEDLLAR